MSRAHNNCTRGKRVTGEYNKREIEDRRKVLIIWEKKDAEKTFAYFDRGCEIKWQVSLLVISFFHRAFSFFLLTFPTFSLFNYLYQLINRVMLLFFFELLFLIYFTLSYLFVSFFSGGGIFYLIIFLSTLHWHRYAGHKPWVFPEHRVLAISGNTTMIHLSQWSTQSLSCGIPSNLWLVKHAIITKTFIREKHDPFRLSTICGKIIMAGCLIFPGHQNYRVDSFILSIALR